ncbi:hypothetical protein ACA910_021430 [Epithemia clementina (nom. ined.)]
MFLSSSSDSSTGRGSVVAYAAALFVDNSASPSPTSSTPKNNYNVNFEQQENMMNYLDQARALSAPIPNTTLYGEDEGYEFWQSHASLIRRAWNQWEELLLQRTADAITESNVDDNEITTPFPELTRQHMDPRLRVAVESAWNSGRAVAAEMNGAKQKVLLQQLQDDEERLRRLWKHVAPGVYACQFLDPHKLADVRRYLDVVIPESGIPTRRPNGMNRYGYILEPTVDGAVHVTGLTHFYRFLVEIYVRPLGRLLFADYIGHHQDDDAESYAFTVRYKDGEDVELNEHSDASLYTLNVNLNLPHYHDKVVDEKDNHEQHSSSSSPRSYEGSGLYFVEEEKDELLGGRTSQSHHRHRRTLHNVTFEPGMAVLHRGITRHAALPITKGERTNLIVWMYGKDGYVRIAPYDDPTEQLSSVHRWTKVNNKNNKNEYHLENNNPVSHDRATDEDASEFSTSIFDDEL